MRCPPAADLSIDPEAVEQFLERQGWSWKTLPDGYTIDRLQYVVLLDDPVVWAEHTLVERDTGALWRLWDYQKHSARYRGHTVHECAAEVGKTREIVLLVGWMMERFRGDILIGASFDGALDDIWDELVDWQFKESPRLFGLIDWNKTKLKPYRKIVTRHGQRVWFRPAAHDGKAFRGVHAMRAFFEEAAKAHEPVIWSEFFRSVKKHPDAEIRLYSVPDGFPNSRFAEICREATDYQKLVRRPGDLLGRQRATYVRFHWPQVERPDWGPELNADAVMHFGSESSPGYRRNVLGIQGEPEDSVFPRELIEPSFSVSSSFVSVRAVRDRAERSTRVVVERVVDIEQTREMAAGGEEDHVGGWLPGILRRWMPAEKIRGEHVGGVDVGISRDPAEIWVARSGPVIRDLFRLQLVRHDYEQIAEAIEAIDRHFGILSAGWGVDVGGKGSAVTSCIRDAGLRSRVSSIFFQTRVAVSDARGNAQRDKDGRAVEVTNKEAGTRLLEGRLATSSYALPPHPELVREFIAHTASMAPSGARRFADRHDHIVDAHRCILLRLQEVEGVATVDIVGPSFVGDRSASSEISSGLRL